MKAGKPAMGRGTINTSVMGMVELIFDALYLLTGLVLGIYLFAGAQSVARRLAGGMALVLVGGDAFHLVPRIASIIYGESEPFQKALGAGKLITSITMTVFYLLLWRVGLALYAPPNAGSWTALAYALAAVRIILCLLPQNRWLHKQPPVSWGVLRNIPFALLGVQVAVLFFSIGQSVPAIRWMWLAVSLSFAFYLPVVLWAHKRPWLGALMLPKSCAYLWMLWMCVGI